MFSLIMALNSNISQAPIRVELNYFRLIIILRHFILQRDVECGTAGATNLYEICNTQKPMSATGCYISSCWRPFSRDVFMPTAVLRAITILIILPRMTIQIRCVYTLGAPEEDRSWPQWHSATTPLKTPAHFRKLLCCKRITMLNFTASYR